MTPTSFTVLRKALGLNQDQLAGLMGRDRRAVMGVENGDDDVPPLYALALERLALSAAAEKQDLNLAPAAVRNDALAYSSLLQGMSPYNFLPKKRNTAMKDGLYVTNFETPLGAGYGVAVLTNGRLRGGDGEMVYSGHYTWEGDEFSATINVDKFAPGPSASVFGADHFALNLKGSGRGDIAEFVATTPAAPGIKMKGSLKRHGD